MKKSRRSNRPHLRSGRGSRCADGAKPGAENAGRLAWAAGSAARATVEPLESRQLLFTMSISADDVDPTTGLGTVRQIFGYAIPILSTAGTVGTNTTTDVDEDFNDEFGQTPPPVQNIPNGLVTTGTFVRINHNIIPGANFQIRAEIGTDGLPTGERFVQARPDQGQFFSFRPQTQQGNSIAAVSMRFTIRAGTGSTAGLDPALFTVQLFYRGNVVQSFTGAQLAARSSTGTGVGRFTFNGTATNPAFDELRVVATGAGADPFILDDLSYTQPAANFAEVANGRIFGAEIALSGRVGSTVQVFDLYGRDMIRTIALGIPQGSNVPIYDLNDDGVPDYNDGIGKIVLTNSDETTAITIFGGIVRPTTQPDPDDDLFEGGFAYRRIENLIGIYDAFEQAGFGFDFNDTQQAPFPTYGLPPGSGSVIIGSPWIRNNATGATYNAGGRPLGANGFAIPAPITSGFTNPNQGVFVQGNRSIGGIYIHGLVMGSSNFTGSVQRVVIGTLLGSVTVAGDLGSLIVGSDAGLYQRDVGQPEILGGRHSFSPDATGVGLVKTNGQLVVGRTLGEVSIAGRSLLDVTVRGDVNDPVNKPALSTSTYYEKEFLYADDPATPEPEVDIFRTLINTDWASSPQFRSSRTIDQGLIFGTSTYRNDSLLSAEWINTLNTGVRIFGDLGARDKLNPGDDQADAYAFASDGTTPISVEVQGAVYFRILDANGRTVAAPSITRGSNTTQFVRYQPTAPGVYYVVLTDPAADDAGFGVSARYSVTMLGLAPVTLGMYRTGGASGAGVTTRSGLLLNNTVNVLAGNVGTLRIGTGRVNAGGTEVSTSDVSNSDAGDADAYMDWLGGTFNMPGTLYSIVTGSDISGGAGALTTDLFAAAVSVNVGGDFGTMITGLSGVAGRGPNEGDVNFFSLRVGGRIGQILVSGASGIDQDATDPLALIAVQGGITRYQSGRSGGNGDIGLVRYGSHVGNDAVQLITSPNSTVGGVLITQDIALTGDVREGLYAGNTGLLTSFGAGTDVRFVDFPKIDSKSSENVTFNLVIGQVQTFVDDGGGQVRIRVLGPADQTGLRAGFVRVLPINGSQGVSIGQIVVDLTGGRSLEIEGVGTPGSDDVISIGRIIVQGADAATSGITIKGNIQTDVWRIDSAGILNFVRNETPLGDIVAMDVQGLNTLNILTGDLGRTQVPTWGPQLIGPFLGINGTVGGRETSLKLPQGTGLMDDDWNGQVYRGVNTANRDAGAAFLDDVGSPFDPYLNGLVARTGTIDTVNVGGAVGDVIALAGDIIRVNANFDRVTPKGRFNGIVGTIFATNISRVDIGDGLAQRDQSPLSTTGIFAVNDIVQILNQNSKVAFISSTITAGNSIVGDKLRDGIDTIDLRGGGDIRDAFISSSNLDQFWIGFNYGDDRRSTGDIFLINGDGADLFRSEVSADNLRTITLKDGAYDATFTNTTGDIGTITAAEFRNSTLKGTDLEFRPNAIQAAGDVTTLTTFQKSGDVTDLLVDINGSVLQEISGRVFTRTQIDVDNTIKLLDVALDLRASKVVAGQVTSLKVNRSIQTSRIAVAGPLPEISVTDSIVNSEIESSGPNGRIEKIVAKNLISGSVRSSGPIDSIEATAGDIRLNVTTTTGKGSVRQIKAARDLDLVSDISGNLSNLVAGRHIGTPGKTGAIVIRGALEQATAGGGLYSDLRVGQTIASVKTGRVISLPTNNQTSTGSIIAFGAINSIDLQGDYAGDIISYSGGIQNVLITNGSYLPGHTIAAYDGSLIFLVIQGGSLMGNVHADYHIWGITVIGDAFGVFGDIGINPKYTSSQPYDAFRNRMPVGVAASTEIQGPTISSGWSIGFVFVANGSIFESTIYAGRAIDRVIVARGVDTDMTTFAQSSADNGNITTDGFTGVIANTIAAGDSISSVQVSGDLVLTYILAGVEDFGADGVPTGVGANRDTVKAGRIGSVSVAGNTYAAVMSAGMNAGADGLYNTGDDTVTLGQSYLTSVTLAGSAQFVSAFSDILTPGLLADSRIFAYGPALEIADPEIDPVLGDLGTPITSAGLSITRGSESATIFFDGPGQAFYDAAGGRVVLVNTGFASNLLVNVTSASGALTDFDIVSNDEASINNLVVNGELRGDSDIVVDAFIVNLAVTSYNGTGAIRLGEDAATMTFGKFVGGTINAKYVNRLEVNGDFGAADASVRDEAYIGLLSAGSIVISGADRGAINVNRDIPNFFVKGAMDSATFRSGASIGLFDVGSMRRTWVSARDFFGGLNVRGDVFDSSIMAGADLGRDTEFGGFGLDADQATTGFMGDVKIAGNFAESDLAAGIIRGSDGFFGTSDDSIAEGRSTMGSVVIGGTEVGSSRDSESYRIFSTGTMGAVTIGGLPGGRVGNFNVESVVLPPLAFGVSQLSVTQEARVYTATVAFNQPVDSSTLASALNVYEVRGVAQTEIRLVNGVDYFLTYDAATHSAKIRFSTTVTDRGLPEQVGVPGPGVYRFKLDQAILRAQLVRSLLDGDGDGRVEISDSYSADDIVGDAGDKLVNQTTTVTDGSTVVATIDFRAATSLDVVMDDNRAPDGLPDANRDYTLRGTIGDHQDHDTNYFRFANDEDVYKITLQAGQILRLGRVTGPAKAIPVGLADSEGNIVSSTSLGTPDASVKVVALPVNLGDDTVDTQEQAFLIKTTGTYYIVVGTTTAFTDPNVVPNLDAVPNQVGDYAFTVQVFDDGNSGFSAPTDAGNGTNVVNAPAPVIFAGVDGVFGTADDLGSVTIGGFTFTLSRGADGVANTADDLVSGTNSDGSITSTRSGAGTQTSLVRSAIGTAGHSGLPVDVFADVDIFHLNNRLPIATGSKVKVTVKLTEVGADLGSRDQTQLVNTLRTLTQAPDYRGNVQFGVFDTTDSTGTDDGKLVFSPTDFSSSGGKAGTIVAGQTATYGFDANGDFFIEFIAPGRQGNPTQAASYAVYLQGAFNTDYAIEVVSSATDGGTNVIQKRKQNVFIETRGGSINWLEAGGATTALRGFQASVLGFTGTLGNGQDAQTYIINTLKSTLQQVFDTAGVDVRFSTDPKEFEFEPFSTVYLSSSADPVSLLFDNLNASFFGLLGGSLQPYGFSERSDPLNADASDDAVVFAPSFAILNYSPSQTQVDLFVQSLSAAVGRRVGELLGLRVTGDNDTAGLSPKFDLMAANGVSNPPGTGKAYEVSGQNRLLSSRFDSITRTDFFLGQQNSKSLLEQVLSAH